MFTDPNIVVDIELLGKYLAGEANAEEAMAIDTWLRVPENKKEFQQIQKIWLAGSSNYNRPETSDEWMRLKTKLPKPKSGTVVSGRFTRYLIAASIVAIILTVIVLRMTSGENSKSNNDIVVNTKGSTPFLMPEILSDGSQVVVGNNSNIKYSDDFNKKHRELELNGEAYFAVVPDSEKPFVIHMKELKIKVIGTAFNVKNANPKTIEVEVLSGVVEMYNETNSLIVKKGQTGIYSKNKKSFQLTDTLDINSVSYATKNFYFNDIPLEEIAVYLEKGFGVEIDIEDKKLLQCRLTAKFEKKTLPYIMDVIVATLNLEYTIDGNKVLIKGTGCN